MAGAELNDDMVSIKENTVTVMTPEGGTLQDYAFREAAYVFYRNGLYYFMWSVDDTGSPNYHVAYGTSKSPLGPIEVAKQPVVLIQNPERRFTVRHTTLYCRFPVQMSGESFTTVSIMVLERWSRRSS